ncbi:hypothetical protein JB92DRAFT_1666515 [Gautieria morchelliformis]|nr:hypothetical protein JB92DRAFT_1666515 [Gautieria morchelliformis]
MLTIYECRMSRPSRLGRYLHAGDRHQLARSDTMVVTPPRQYNPLHEPLNTADAKERLGLNFKIDIQTFWRKASLLSALRKHAIDCRARVPDKHVACSRRSHACRGALDTRNYVKNHDPNLALMDLFVPSGPPYLEARMNVASRKESTLSWRTLEDTSSTRCLSHAPRDCHTEGPYSHMAAYVSAALEPADKPQCRMMVLPEEY